MSMNPSTPFGTIDSPFFSIYITHLPTNQEIRFRGWVTDFSDTFTSNWTKENVYGRMDPLATFENTQRQITLGFDVVSGNLSEATNNLLLVNRLIEFLYPVYEHGPLSDANDGRTMQNTLKAAPLIGLRYTNLIGNPLDGQKLVGYLGGVNYAPDMSYGGFIPGGGEGGEAPHVAEQEGDTRSVDEGKRAYVPKVLNLSLDYTVLHTHLTGWYNKHGVATGVAGPEGPYSFGGSEIDGKFPNAFMRKYDSQTVSDAEGNVRNVQVDESNETDILGG